MGRANTLDKMDIQDRLQSASIGLTAQTISMLFGLLDRRQQTAKIILNDGNVPVEDMISIMDEFKDQFIKILNL